MNKLTKSVCLASLLVVMTPSFASIATDCSGVHPNYTREVCPFLTGENSVINELYPETMVPTTDLNKLIAANPTLQETQASGQGGGSAQQSQQNCVSTAFGVTCTPAGSAPSSPSSSPF